MEIHSRLCKQQRKTSRSTALLSNTTFVPNSSPRDYSQYSVWGLSAPCRVGTAGHLFEFWWSSYLIWTYLIYPGLGSAIRNALACALPVAGGANKGFRILPKDVSKCGYQTTNPVISRQPALPPKPQPLHGKLNVRVSVSEESCIYSSSVVWIILTRVNSSCAA